jgi:hypothetical protein
MILGSSITLTSAFGRDYRSADAAHNDWLAGKDFRIGIDGPYCSNRDVNMLYAQGVRTIRLRYGKLRNVAEFPLRPDDVVKEPQ